MNLFIYYHMPIRRENRNTFFNPVMGTFIESLQGYFSKITVISFNRDSDVTINYRIKNTENLDVISLGSEGRYYNYFIKLIRSKKSLSNLKFENSDIILEVCQLHFFTPFGNN